MELQFERVNRAKGELVLGAINKFRFRAWRPRNGNFYAVRTIIREVPREFCFGLHKAAELFPWLLFPLFFHSALFRAPGLAPCSNFDPTTFARLIISSRL